VSEAHESDGQLLRRRRREAGLSLQNLAELAHYDKGYLSRVENGKQAISVAVAEACDDVLRTSSELTRRAIAAAARPRHALLPVAQLPAAPSNLVGRAGPLTRLAKLSAVHDDRPGSVPVVCIDGPPGVGKTALALRYAHDIAGRFPGGVLFAALRGYGTDAGAAEPGEILDGFLRSLGTPPDRIPASIEQRASLFRTLVHGRGILLVLDNAASSQQVRPLLPGSADCAVLLTSRRRLTGLLLAAAPATSMTLNPLGPDDARELLRAVVGADRIDAEPRAADDVARRCAYLPLALRIAAVRIAENSHESVADLAAGLSAEHERLDFLAAGDDDTLTVRGVFSWSYLALGTDAARQFRLLGLHPATSFSIGAAAALAGVAWSDAQRLVDALTEAHLVEHIGKDRYHLHDLLRVYAQEQARNLESHDDYAVATRRLVDWYLVSSDAAVRALTPSRPHIDLPPAAPGVHAAEFGPDDYERALRWCDREFPALVKMTSLAADQRLDDQAWQLPAVWLDYFFLRQPWDEWIATNEIGIAAAQRGDNDFGHGCALTNLAEAHRRRGDLDTAEAQFQEALRICPGRIGQGWALAGLAFTRLDRGDHQGATGYLEQMAEVFEAIDMVYGIATALANLGVAHRELGDIDQAVSYGQRAYNLYVSINDRGGEAYALPRLARTVRRRGDNQGALRLCEDALVASRESGDRWAEADALEIRGMILHETDGQISGADSLLEALSIFEGLDDRRATMLRETLVDANILAHPSSGDST
jgi:tetratricopeptide (TPR) repeat protein